MCQPYIESATTFSDKMIDDSMSNFFYYRRSIMCMHIREQLIVVLSSI